MQTGVSCQPSVINLIALERGEESELKDLTELKVGNKLATY
ncbi:MAG: hypothetical protein SWX82_00050 [Cyanobacteriota bacterium]|nr:hypothetical protein [Cyanobacteriota bacterium]